MIGSRWVDRARRRFVGLWPFPSAQSNSDERPLWAIAGVGPAQVALSESVRAAWPERASVVWLEQCSDTAADALRKAADDSRATRVIAVGLEAVYAARDALQGLPIDGMFLHHELDFRFSNEHRQNRLLEGFSACDRLWFDSTVAMDKAAAHGSTRPHLLIPLPSMSTTRLKMSASAQVAIVTSHEKLTAAEERTVGSVRSAISDAGGRSSVHSVGLFYTSEDLHLDRSWIDAIQMNLPDHVSHAVLIGKSGHHLFAVLGLQSLSVEVFVEATVENTAIARRLQLSEHHVARGAALIERVVTAVSNREANSRDRSFPEISASGFRTAIDSVVTRSLPDWHEESLLDVDQSQFDVFFSVAAIENRNNGARPQRIRAMSQSFEEPDVPLVRMTSNLNLLRRRLRGALSLTHSGASPRWGYGENSTAPMPAEARMMLEDGLKDLRSAGLRFAWYVRDFHWLDPDSPVSQSRPDIVQLRENGLAEFVAMRKVADVLYAPSTRSAHKFDELLRAHSKIVATDWRVLPPGVDIANCLARPIPYSGKHGPLRILYSGGIGGVYDMATAMTALAELSDDWELHMTVRPEDMDAAHHLTSALPRQKVYVSSGEFADVCVPSGPAVGLALLDTSYGLASFPLKVMSYLEKGLQVLVYRGSSPADLITAFGAGRIADHDPKSVKDELESMATNPVSVDWQLLRERESWNARADQVRSELYRQSHR